MFTDAWNEFEELPAERSHLPKVILNNLEKWQDAASVAEGALRHYPDFGALYLAAAHAVRNCRGPADAKTVLSRGRAPA